MDRLRRWARTLRRDAHAVWLCARDPRTPWAARLVAMAVAAYALSPIDLIPDFVPVLGYLDDLILVPLGLWLVLRMIPPAVLARHRAAADAAAERPASRAAVVVIVGVWIAVAAATGLALLAALR